MHRNENIVNSFASLVLTNSEKCLLLVAVCAAPGSKTFQLLEMIHQSMPPETLPSGMVFTYPTLSFSHLQSSVHLIY